MNIGEPALLTKLPRSALSNESDAKFCQVHGVKHGQRKKRHEICAAISGNSLSIFEVVNGRNVVSWPVPPDSTFVSTPYSERVQVENNQFARRSWCAVRRQGQLQVQCYEETRNLAGPTISTKNYSLKHQSAVVKIEPVNTKARELLVVQEDGQVTIVPPSNIATSDVKLKDALGTVKIFATQCTTLKEAQLSVLKSRQDLTSGLTLDHLVVTSVYKQTSNPQSEGSNVRIGVWAFTATTLADLTTLEPLVAYDLPLQHLSAAPKPQSFEFTANGTKLDVKDMDTITTFDITTTVPQTLFARTQPVPEAISSMDLGHDVHLYLSTGKAELYNTRYNSLLASSTFEQPTLKRKRDISAGLSRLSCIAYFSQMWRVVACNGQHLLTFDIGFRDMTQNAFKQSSLLSGNVLRGRPKEAKEKKSWQSTECSIGRVQLDRSVKVLAQTSERLDALAGDDNAEDFEAAFITSFDIDQARSTISTHQRGAVDYLLSKIFTLSNRLNVQTHGETHQDLNIVMLPTNLVRWCIRCGALEERRIAQVLQVNFAVLSPTAVADALLNVDPTLALADYYIQHYPCLQPEALTTLARTLLLRALDQSTTGAQKRIEGAQVEDQLPEDGQTLATSSIPMPAIDELEDSTPTTVCLAHTLTRLALTGPATVSAQIRNKFDQRAVLALIQFLRQQLFVGGYTRLGGDKRLPSPPPSADGNEEARPSSNPQLTLQTIVTLLNGSVDAIGLVGIFGSKEYEEFVQTMIPDLFSEITSATTAVEDSTQLQGLLRETLRYAESVERQPFEVRAKVEKATTDQTERGHIVTIYTEPEKQELGSHMKSALPMSLRAEEDIDKFKVRKGTGQKTRRSAREMGMLKDRLKSSYSFERLVL